MQRVVVETVHATMEIPASDTSPVTIQVDGDVELRDRRPWLRHLTLGEYYHERRWQQHPRRRVRVIDV